MRITPNTEREGERERERHGSERCYRKLIALRSIVMIQNIYTVTSRRIGLSIRPHVSHEYTR